MANTYKGELQDYKGNTLYNHSEADVIFCTDGESVQEKLAKTEEVLGDSTGKTGSLEVNDSQKLVTSDATHELANRTTFPDNKGFYPDCKDGKYGYNTDPNRGADTFHPFKRGLDLPYDLLQNQIGGISPIMTIEVDVSKIVCGTNPIDFTNISKIDASFGHANGTFYFALTDEPLSTASEIQNNAIFVQTTSSNSVFKTIDTSNITGEKYLSIYLYTSTNLNGYIASLVVS